MKIKGMHFDGREPLAVPATMSFSAGSATLTVGNGENEISFDQLTVSPRIGQAERFINLPRGAQFVCPDHLIFDSLPQESPSEGPVAWLEARWGVALSGVAIVAAILLVGYFYYLPIASERVAATIPILTERMLGDQALSWLDKNWFKPTEIELRRQRDIRAAFESLSDGLLLNTHYRLEFRSTRGFCPNAFALPGGIIVVTDDLVKLSVFDDGVVAVLAHEIAHVELRHTLRSVLLNSAVAVLSAAVTSDAASLSVAVSGLPMLFVQTKYSREFESAADAYAFKLLKQNGYSPAAFAAIMERLSNTRMGFERAFNFISTHPSSTARIERAHESAKTFESPMKITSNSMAPGLMKGQSVVITSIPSLKRSLRRGDVVLFLEKPESLSLKRIVGLPGDTIELKDGQLYVDGRDVLRNRLIRNECNNKLATIFDGSPPSDRRIECVYELPGSIRYMVLLERDTATSSSKYDVPEGHYFVMVDNRIEANLNRNKGSKTGDLIGAGSILGVVTVEH